MKTEKTYNKITQRRNRRTGQGYEYKEWAIKKINTLLRKGKTMSEALAIINEAYPCTKSH